jgi:Fic family protein
MTGGEIQGSNISYQPFAGPEIWASSAVSEDVWNSYLDVLASERRDATEESLKRALDEALRTAAIETGAIEGLYSTSRGVTRTIAVQSASWESAIGEMGEDVKGHFEAQLEALEMMLDVATNRLPVTEAWVRALHAQVCAGQETYKALTSAGWQNIELKKGVYKSQPNHVELATGETHFYAPPELTASEMQRLVDVLQSEQFAALPPQVQAAYAHYAFVAIHPFADGNGRVARALASVYLYRAISVPLVIFSDQQVAYWDALSEADKGLTQEFVTFIEDRSIDAMGMIADSLKIARRGDLTTAAQSLRGALGQHQGYSPAEVEGMARRVEDLAGILYQTRVEQLINEGSLPTDVQRSTSGSSGNNFTFWERGYHVVRGMNFNQFHLRIAGTSSIGEMTVPVVGVSDDVNNRFAVMLADSRREHVSPLLFRLTDLHPEISSSTRARMEAWIDGVIYEMLSEIRQQLHENGA